MPYTHNRLKSPLTKLYSYDFQNNLIICINYENICRRLFII